MAAMIIMLINNAFHIGDPGSFCHAFNGLEYFPSPEKHKLNKPEKQVPGVFLPNVILSEQVFPFQKSFLESRGSPPVLPDLLGTSSGLRAPPYLS